MVLGDKSHKTAEVVPSRRRKSASTVAAMIVYALHIGTIDHPLAALPHPQAQIDIFEVEEVPIVEDTISLTIASTKKHRSPQAPIHFRRLRLVQLGLKIRAKKSRMPTQPTQWTPRIQHDRPCIKPAHRRLNSSIRIAQPRQEDTRVRSLVKQFDRRIECPRGDAQIGIRDQQALTPAETKGKVDAGRESYIALVQHRDGQLAGLGSNHLLRRIVGNDQLHRFPCRMPLQRGDQLLKFVR